MSQPLVSIIIPTYNRAHLIGETLDSVLAQTYQNWECIVVDDGSTDNTDEVMAGYIAKDSRFQYYHRPADRLPGGNAARNYGFEVSKGEYVQWFDSDDLMIENKLSLNMEIFLKSDMDVVFNLYKEFPRGIDFDNFANYDEELNLFENLVSKKIKINTPSSIWKKSTLIDQELFDENIFKGQELDFYARIFFSNSVKFRILKEITSLIRKQERGILTDYHKMENTEMIKSFLILRRRIHLMVNKNNNSELIFHVLRFYEQTLLKLIRHKEYELAVSEIEFLTKNPPSLSRFIYKNRVLKLRLLIQLLKLTKGKGFFRLKVILYDK